MEYHKIQTVFKRPQTGNAQYVIEGEWSLPEFEYLASNVWVFTEKVDGTNVRVIKDGDQVRFGGKTERAQLPTKLDMRLRELFPNCDKLAGVFSDAPSVVLYGEGFGAGIQKGGGNYGSAQDFVLFDVLVGDWWLQRSDVEDVAHALGIQVVPVIGAGPLGGAIEMVRNGMLSRWGNFLAEGIVARPRVELRDRAGRRIITKIKHRDFPTAS